MNKLFQAATETIHRLNTQGTLTVLAALFAVLSLHAPAPAQTTESVDEKMGDAILIMDYSNSMWGQINGVSKMEIARDLINRNFRRWDSEINMGLLSYGHRYKNDCADIQLIAEPGSENHSSIETFLSQAKPKGRTPLTSAIEKAASYFISNGEKANIILLTDGIESCDRNPCETIQALGQAGVDMTAHVIGFGVTEAEGSQLRCIASLTGGEYLNASNPSSLDLAFRKIMNSIQMEGTISTLELRNSKLKDTITASQDEIVRLADENSNLAAQGVDLQAKTSEVEVRMERLKNALRDTEMRHGQMQVVNQKLQDQNSEMLVQHGELRAEVLRLEGLLAQNEDLRYHLETELQTTQGELASTENKLLLSEDDLVGATNQLRVKSTDLLETRALLTETQNERERLWALTGKLRGEVDGLRDDITSASFENARLLQSNIDLKQQNTELLSALNTMMSAISASNKAIMSAYSIGTTVSDTLNLQVAPIAAGEVDEDASLRTDIPAVPAPRMLPTPTPTETAQTPSAGALASAALASTIAELSATRGFDRVELMLAEGVAPALPDVEWTVSQRDRTGRTANTIAGRGNNFALPSKTGMYEVAVAMKPFIQKFQIEVDGQQPQVHGVNFMLGRLEVEDARIAGEETLLKFQHADGQVIEHMLTGDDVLYLPYGDYTFTTTTAQSSLSQDLSINPGDTQSISVQSL